MDITKRELLLRRGKERNTMELKSASYEKHDCYSFTYLKMATNDSL